MKWVFATNQASLESPKQDWSRLIRVAINSARKNTALEPFMLYDGADNEMIHEVRRLGVTIIRHRLSFYNFIVEYHKQAKPEHPHYVQTASSAFLRVDLPTLFSKDEFVLYTDCDVMFLKNPCVSGLRPKYFACAPERPRGDTTNINTGVMLMNIKTLRGDHPSFCKFIQENYAKLISYDQGAYIAYYDGRWDPLPDELNWKPYWGIHGDPQIIHFHGPKPRTALAFLTNPHFDAPKIIQTIYYQDPSAYDEFVGMWNNFQSGCATARDEAERYDTNQNSSNASDAADSPELLILLSKLNERIASAGEEIEGNICYLDQTPPKELLTTMPIMESNHIKKRKNLASVARKSTAMLEIGLNGGHSALLCLHSNPNLTLVAVDIFRHKYVELAAGFLSEQFPRRFQFMKGDSRDILPRIALEKPKLRFDAIHIDGGHAENIVYADVSNTLPLARKDALFIINDLQASWLARIFDECMLLGHFRPTRLNEFINTRLHEVVRVKL